MVKKIFITLLLSTIAQTKEPSPLLKQNCLKCHTEQKIPSELVYRRYLMKFSTKERMQKSLLSYLKNPKKENSIMPQQFFLKFPKKEALDLNNTILEESISVYLDYFDVKGKLELQN